MSFISLTRSLACSRNLSARFNSSAASTKKPASNWPLLLLVGGCTGLGTYVYLEKYKKQMASPLDAEKWVDFKLKKITPYNHNTSKYVWRAPAPYLVDLSLSPRFIFEIPDNQASLLPVASCVVVRASNPEALTGDSGKPIVRPYTPISPSDKRGELTFLIKRYDQGNASKYIHSLNVGDSLAIKGPIPKFEYKGAIFPLLAAFLDHEFQPTSLIKWGSLAVVAACASPCASTQWISDRGIQNTSLSNSQPCPRIAYQYHQVYPPFC